MSWLTRSLGNKSPQKTPHLGMSDHISVNLIPAYKPLICRTRPTTRTVQVWTEEASSALQDCFECTDWEVFKEGTDLDGYTSSSVLSYLKFCTDAVLPTKTIKVFSNRKSWLDSTVKPLLKACDAAYRSGDKLAYSIAHYRKELKKGLLPDLDSIYVGRMQKKVRHEILPPIPDPPGKWTVCTASIWKTQAELEDLVEGSPISVAEVTGGSQEVPQQQGWDEQISPDVLHLDHVFSFSLTVIV
ncbi:hypothetical protein L3Q82_003360 [Scortum barcoo]|uniref:Uncharacterized protein n=1 Tax=Scortum barcoo TaxID=214431 RepID=A0ACB8VMH5_9TELE|nr:hypothetical protein L3Q82_003360 [Scortum barcoo]